jgi:hypothetical protein
MSKQTLLGTGANGFYYQQVTADSDKGDRLLGANEGTDVGIGPVVTLIHTSQKYNFSFQAKCLPEVYKEPTQWQLGVGRGRRAILTRMQLSRKSAVFNKSQRLTMRRLKMQGVSSSPRVPSI